MKKRKQPIVAAAQIKYFEGYSKNNLSKIKRYINLAKQKNADIVCFPESCVHKTATLHKNHKLIKEIREELEKTGHRFFSKTDTEVIIHLYEEYGFSCFLLISGLFNGFELTPKTGQKIFFNNGKSQGYGNKNRR